MLGKNVLLNFAHEFLEIIEKEFRWSFEILNHEKC